MEMIRRGILSTADINNIMIPAIRNVERCEVTAIGSRSSEGAKSFASKHNITKFYDSFESLLNDRKIDAVYICLPNGLHHEWCIKAARAGKHILCEKPLATTVENCNEIIDEANMNDVVLQEGLMYRFHPQTLKIKELIDNGLIGRIEYLYGGFSYNLNEAYGSQTNNYRLNAGLGGGCLWDIGYYAIN